MRNSTPIEGTPAAQLVQIMKQAGYNNFDRLELATVTAAPPDIRIKIDHDKIDYDASDLIISEHLTDRTAVIVRGGIDETVTYKDALKVGDRVMVSSMNGEQTHFVIDRVVTY